MTVNGWWRAVEDRRVTMIAKLHVADAYALACEDVLRLIEEARDAHRRAVFTTGSWDEAERKADELRAARERVKRVLKLPDDTLVEVSL